MACRPSEEDAARSRRWKTPWMSITTARELQFDVWIEVIFAAQSRRKKWGVIRVGLGGC